MQGSKGCDVVDAVLLASRVLVGVAARSLGAAPIEVTLPQHRALVVLTTAGPRSASELAGELCIAPSSVTRLCDRLVRKGLIDRSPHPDSRRAVVITATPEGRALVAAVLDARRAEIARIVRRIPVAERPGLVHALDTFAGAAGEVPEQVWSGGWA